MYLKKANLLFISLLLILPISGFCYTRERIDGGGATIWQSDAQTALQVRLNSANSSGISDSSVSTIVSDALTQWNQHSKIGLSLLTTSGAPEVFLNDLYFTSNSTIFSGSGVLAVTQNLITSTGNIIESNILINDDVIFSSVKGNDLYLGDVVTHELGHLLGLSHSQVHGATMFYSNRVGQYQVETDDIAGATKLYGGGSSAGSISGVIVGGESLVGIFGAHVKAIKLSDGEVAAAAISDEGGSFSIVNLPVNEKYHLYIEPLGALSSLPLYFQGARKDFCTGDSDFVGTFFQGCLNAHKGYPIAIELTSAAPSGSAGNVSINCGLRVSSDYMLSKGGTFAPDVVHDDGSVGNSFLGFFTATDVAANTADTITLDLSTYNVPESLLFLEIQVVSQDLFSDLKTEMVITGQGTFSPSTDSEGNPELKLTAKIPLVTGLSSTNSFSLSITPDTVENYITANLLSFTKSDFFPASDDFLDSKSFYLLTAKIVKFNGSAYEPYTSRDYSTFGDNATCPGASRSFNVKSRASGDLDSLARSSPEGAACGTVDFDNDDGPGPNMLSLVIGIFLPFFVRKRRSIFYS